MFRHQTVQHSAPKLCSLSLEAAKLAPADDEKVTNIMEVWSVNRGEGICVLDGCHVVTMERILSGNFLSSLSEVSNKKKQPTFQCHQSCHRDRKPDQDLQGSD